MGTFGKTTKSGTAFSVVSNEYDSAKYVLARDAVITEMWADCQSGANVTDVGIKLAIYTDSGGLPATFKGATDEMTFLAAGVSRAWRRFTIASPIALTAGTYHLGSMGYSGTVSAGVTIFGDSVTGAGAFDTQSTGYPNFDNPATTPTSDNVAYSIFAVFEDPPEPRRRAFPLMLQRFRPGRSPFPFAFPTPAVQVAAASPDVTVNADSGNLVLSAGTAVPAISATPTVGDLALSAGTQTPKVSTTPTAGNLVLAAGVHVPSVATTPPAGNLVLNAGTAAPRVDISTAAGNLVLSAGTQTPRISVTPPVGDFVLGAASPTVQTGSSVTVTPTSGDIVLSAGTATPSVSTIPTAGAVTLSAGAAAVKVAVTPPSGDLTLGAANPTTTGGTGPARPTDVRDPASVYVTL